jgi:hypothetical protein
VTFIVPCGKTLATVKGHDHLQIKPNQFLRIKLEGKENEGSKCKTLKELKRDESLCISTLILLSVYSETLVRISFSSSF